MRIIAYVTAIAAVLELLVAVWWWALVGMSDDVATAHGVTSLVLGAVAAFAAIESL